MSNSHRSTLPPTLAALCLAALCLAALLAAACAPVTAPPPAPAPPAATAPPGPAWQVDTLLAAPLETGTADAAGAGGRLYALLKDTPGPLWAFPAADVRLLVSEDGAATWTPFAGGLPVPAPCMVSLALDPSTPAALYAGTCQGLYAWDEGAGGWVKRSDQRADAPAVAPSPLPDHRPVLWAGVRGDGVMRSGDGGKSWADASAGLVTFGGVAALVVDPHAADAQGALYAVIQPQYAGSYLRRRIGEGDWVTLPTPQGDTAIQTGLALDAGGALYVTTLTAPVGLWRADNAAAPDPAAVTWTSVHDFGADVQVSLLAAAPAPASAAGPTLYVNIWPLTPLAGGGADVGAPVLHRSADGGQTWEPLTIPSP